MPTAMPRRSRLLLVPIVAVAAACHRTRSAPATPAPTASTTTTDDAAERARREAEARAAARRAEEERLRAERQAAERARATARETLQASIYFAFDRSDLDAQARTTLESKLPVLQANTDVRIRIAGHTDERGADEYNLALGSRRAAAAKRFLTQRGIDEARIEIVSFGEERPVCTASEESCWAQNRRDTFEITVGTIASAPYAGGQR
jgi:peptidoglycan-associated lipoprotein